MLHIFCDDGSTNVKLAWYHDNELKTVVSANSFRFGWKIDGIKRSRTFNYLVDGVKYTFDEVSQDAINTTNIEYQYGNTNLLAVHHALLHCDLQPQKISLTVTLPVSEFYTSDCQKNQLNIQRKIDNLLKPVTLNKSDTFTVTSVDVMPESLPAVFSELVTDNVGKLETSLVIDLGGTTMDVGVIVGKFEDVSAIHGNPSIGVSMVTQAVLSALKMSSSDTSALVADRIIQERDNLSFVRQVVNDESKIDLVLNTIKTEIQKLGETVINELAKFRNVNRVYLVGGGAPLIANAVKNAYSHLGDKVKLIDNPQLALVKAIARFKQGA